MYCVKCGVELANSEDKCPLCGTPVYYPDRGELEPSYPKFEKSKEEISPRGVYFIITCLLIVACVITVFCDLGLNPGISFSGYVVFGIALFYVLFILPGWFRKSSPAVFAPVDFAAVGLYLFYVSEKSGGGWFLSFALPIVGGAALIFVTLTVLLYYIRKGKLYIFGGTSIALGAFAMLIEYLIHKNFGIVHRVPFAWSVYPATALTLIGLMLLTIAIVKPFRDSLKKIFAV